KGDAPVLRHHQFQDRLLEVGAVVFRVAMSNVNGVRITVRDVLASERKAGRVEMIEAQINAFVSTDRTGQFLKQQVAAIGRGFLEGATELETVEHRGIDAFTQQEIEGFVGKKLRR